MTLRRLLLLLLLSGLVPGVAAQEKPTPETPAEVPVASTATTPAAALDAETKCLALSVYWEGKTETREGQMAVAHTVLNRSKNPKFPDTICGVVAQKPEGGKKGCQFSWWCDGKRDEPKDDKDWQDAVDVAKAAMKNAGDPTGGALYFHSSKIKPPAWAAKRERLARIGDHIFYR